MSGSSGAAKDFAAAAAAESDAALEFVCPYTKKKFRSRSTYESYLRSKKYLQLVAKAQASSPPLEATGAQRTNSQSEQEFASERVTDDIENDAAGRAGPATQQPVAPGARDSAGADEEATGNGGGSDEDDDGWEDEDDGPWVPQWSRSLFDGHASASFEANVSYMRRHHSFIVPFADRLAEPRRLFAYLQEKVERRGVCLCCQRAFGSAEACRSHMRDKAHCRVDCESAAGAQELRPFYFGGLPGLHARGGVSAMRTGSARRGTRAGASSEGDAGDAGDAGDGGDGGDGDADADIFSAAGGGGTAADAFELVLADGRRLGHRSLRTYYRQKFAPAAQSWTLRLRQSQRALEAKLAVRAAARERYKLLLRGTAVAKGLHSKALAAQFVFKASFADNKHARALQHHGYGGFGGGAHYTMAGSKQFQRGVRIKGVVSRHSKQAAKRNGLKMRQQAARRD